MMAPHGIHVVSIIEDVRKLCDGEAMQSMALGNSANDIDPENPSNMTCDFPLVWNRIRGKLLRVVVEPEDAVKEVPVEPSKRSNVYDSLPKPDRLPILLQGAVYDLVCSIIPLYDIRNRMFVPTGWVPKSCDSNQPTAKDKEKFAAMKTDAAVFDIELGNAE